MAVNPMQRRARLSFLIGFLVALILMGAVAAFLLLQVKSTKSQLGEIEALQKSYVVASRDLKSGEEINFDEDFTTATVRTNVSQAEVISQDDWEYVNKDGEIITKLDDKGVEKKKTLTMKIDVPAGTIVTKNMVNDVENERTDTTRIQEYNMIVLPSQLVNGDYIDIRISLPNGQDYIVLSKKLVIGTNVQSLWLELTEEEMLTLNNAIVESYTISGSKLYAIQYVEAGLQNASIPNYTVSGDVLTLINTDPNITEEARKNLWAKYIADNRTKYFEPALDPNRDSQSSLVSSGNSSEIESVRSARQEFVDSLEGSEDVGYTR